MVEFAESCEDLIGRPEVAAVVLATPLSTHYPLGLQAIEAGKHLLVEKPIAASSDEARELTERADGAGLVLMVDHTFIYTGAVRKLRELVQDQELGDLLYFDSVRVNLGIFQHDTNVVWDLAPHDISILDHLVAREPESVQAIGARHYYEYEDMAYLGVRYAGNLLAHFHVNWISPVKVRRILVGGTKRMVLYDDMEPSEKIKVYDSGVELGSREDIYRTLVQYRTGDMLAPKLDLSEALGLMCREFVLSITDQREPLTGAASGLNVVRILEAADRSLASGGTVVRL